MRSWDEAQLDLVSALVGGTWDQRSSRSTADNGPDPKRQLTVMNARAIALVAQDRDRWSLTGDQLYVDLDLSHANLPAGTRLAIGSAVIEVTRHRTSGASSSPDASASTRCGS